MNNERVAELVSRFEMTPHPEGGFYKEVYRSANEIPGIQRNYLTSIYFLLVDDKVSNFHRIQSDECWYFHEGTPLLVHEIDSKGKYSSTTLGLDVSEGQVPFTVVPANTIFGSHLKDFSGYALVSCAVSPGFDFEDFELFTRNELLYDYPTHQDIIHVLTPNE